MHKFNHNVKPDEQGRHPIYSHLVMFEIERHYGSYILTAPKTCEGNALISAENAEHIFGEQFDQEFAYLTDEYLNMLS